MTEHVIPKLSKKMYDVRAIANWFLDKAESERVYLTNMALNKIIYFAVENALLKKNALITDAKIEAWEHGPVFREVYHAFKSFERNYIESRASKFDIDSRLMVKASEYFSEEVLNVLEETYSSYGNLTAAQLRAISHQPGGAWDTVWWHEGKVNPGMEITRQTIENSLQRSIATNG